MDAGNELPETLGWIMVIVIVASSLVGAGLGLLLGFYSPKRIKDVSGKRRKAIIGMGISFGLLATMCSMWILLDNTLTSLSIADYIGTFFLSLIAGSAAGIYMYKNVHRLQMKMAQLRESSAKDEDEDTSHGT